MRARDTIQLLDIQPHCKSLGRKSFVTSVAMRLPDDPGDAGRWTKHERELRGMSAGDLADLINGLAREVGDPTSIYQQIVSKWEQGRGKKFPNWTRFIVPAFEVRDGGTLEDPHLHTGLDDSSVLVRFLPDWAGLGAGGTGEGDPGKMSFSRDLIERELRSHPDDLLAMVCEGNSMEPEYFGGDVILVNTRKKSLAQPGAFCLWDGDGHVIKYLERIPDSDPAKVLVVSRNGDLYPPRERLLDDISLIGKVIWFGRRVQ